jgi:hypothetical protein
VIESEPVKYTGRTASLQLGNEIAQHSIDFIRGHWPPESHARMFLLEARRLSAAHWHVAVTPRRDMLGAVFVDKDYAEALKQAAANVIWRVLMDAGKVQLTGKRTAPAREPLNVRTAQGGRGQDARLGRKSGEAGQGLGRRL